MADWLNKKCRGGRYVYAPIRLERRGFVAEVVGGQVEVTGSEFGWPKLNAGDILGYEAGQPWKLDDQQVNALGRTRRFLLKTMGRVHF